MTKLNTKAAAVIAALTMGATLVATTGEAKAWCGYYGCGGYGYGAGAVAAGVATGLVLGAAAAAASQPRYGSRAVRVRRASR